MRRLAISGNGFIGNFGAPGIGIVLWFCDVNGNFNNGVGLLEANLDACAQDPSVSIEDEFWIGPDEIQIHAELLGHQTNRRRKLA
jgi:hypothetical protein